MSVDLSGEITAIATAGLAVFAIVTAIYAIRAFRKQSKEVSDQAEMLKVQSQQLAEQRKLNEEQLGVLALQATELRESLDQRKREAETRRKAQASRVYMWQERAPKETFDSPSEVRALARNASDQPVYDAELYWRHGSAGHGDPNPEPLGAIMPDSETFSDREFPDDSNMDACGAILRFRDAAGIKWIRRPDGGLVEQDLRARRPPDVG